MAPDLGGADLLEVPQRYFERRVVIDGQGRSPAVKLTVPPRTRSITVVLETGGDVLVALAALAGPDGIDRVGLPVGEPLPELLQRLHNDVRVGLMPGALAQVVRLGTFTAIYPQVPGQTLADGEWSLVVASDGPGRDVRVRAFMPEDDGGRVLHLNLVTVSDSAPAAEEVLPAAAEILARAGITVVSDEARRLTGTPYATLDESFGTNPGPNSELCQLARFGRAGAGNSALNVFVVDAFQAPPVRGASLGLPGPPDDNSYYYGVFVRSDADPVRRARTMAHEIAHYLALQHVENVAGAVVYSDVHDDTSPNTGNLMDTGDGTLISASQAYALSRSAMLRSP
jgi:hypothetical protein